MSAKILDGKLLATQLKSELAERVRRLKESTGKTPTLYSVSFLQDAAIDSYKSSQERTAHALGIDYQYRLLNVKDTQEAVNQIKDLMKENPLAGFFVFTPTPKHIDFANLNTSFTNLTMIEGVFPFNIGSFVLGKQALIPPTPAAAMVLLKSSGISLEGKRAVVLGRSNTVGKPLIHLLLAENMTVSVCHSKTSLEDLKSMVLSADVVMACVGKAAFVKKEWIKPGAVVIDIGINDVNGQIKGDVDDDVKEVAGFLSPVPGGVGPVTSVMLMHNVVEVFDKTRK